MKLSFAKMVKQISLFLLAAVCFFPAYAYSDEPYWKEYGIELYRLSTRQLGKLEETVNFLREMKTHQPTMKQNLYNRYSKFEKLFGFKFSGPELSRWLLKRIKSVSYEDGWTSAQNLNMGNFHLGERFFNESNMLERLYGLIHEARHSDGNGFKHVKCPKGYDYLSAGSPNIDLQRVKACDEIENGAYGFQSAFLYELYARGILDQREAGLVYNSSVARIIGKRE